MKIRQRLAYKYIAATAVILFFILSLIYLFSKDNREVEFYRDLKKEAITKANLFLDHRVDAKTMQSIYLNNRSFINEVEVAIYSESGNLLYHDAIEIDIVKETPSMISNIKQKESIEFYSNEYQAIGMLYDFHGHKYILTAAAYDGYGYAKLKALAQILLLSFVLGLGILFIAGYYLAKGALSPVSKIVKEAKNISAKNLNKRIPIEQEKDELGELAASFNEMLDRIEKAFDAQQQFVSNVSHELKTPMAALISELEITLLKPRTNEEYIKSMQRALQDGYNINKLAEGLLNLAKANYLPEKIKMSNVRLDEVLLDARALVLKANTHYKVDLLFEQESDEENLITVYGNEYLLKTAFVNFMENNCKFSKNNTCLIQITFWSEYSILRFSDTGKGISEEDINHIFEPFYRGKHNENIKGFGIGMALCKNIIKIHEGEIEVHSEINVGTTYTVKLPHI